MSSPWELSPPKKTYLEKIWNGTQKKLVKKFCVSYPKQKILVFMTKIHISNRFRVITDFMDFKKIWTDERVCQKWSKMAISKFFKMVYKGQK